jgi:hypothetical protein
MKGGDCDIILSINPTFPCSDCRKPQSAFFLVICYLAQYSNPGYRDCNSEALPLYKTYSLVEQKTHLISR